MHMLIKPLKLKFICIYILLNSNAGNASSPIGIVVGIVLCVLLVAMVITVAVVIVIK